MKVRSLGFFVAVAVAALAVAALAASAYAGYPTVVPAALRSLSPSGIRRGSTATFSLGGVNISDAAAATFDDPGIHGTIHRAADPAKARGELKVEVAVGPAVPVGLHSVSLRTPLGVTGSLTYAVGAWPEVAEKEPNDDAASAQRVTLPATLLGTIDKPGDVDCFRFEARAGQEILFQALAAPLRSRLNPVLTLLDDRGQVVAESGKSDGAPEGLLGHRFTRSGTYTLRMRDFENAGGGDYTYRLNAGEFAYVTGFFPLGVQGGTATDIYLTGYGLGDTTKVHLQAPAAATRGETIPLPLPALRDRLLNAPRLAVGADPEMTEKDDAGNDTPAGAESVPVPVTINGRLYHPAPSAAPLDARRPTLKLTSSRNSRPAAPPPTLGTQGLAPKAQGPRARAWALSPDTSPTSNAGSAGADHFRFDARKGEPLILEVAARRLGSPLDSILDVLDSAGHPVERATLRCVAQTVTTLSDRDSASQGLRLLAWPDFRVNDLVYIDGEVARIAALPRGPDDDMIFAGFRGQRLGFLDTTPRAHSMETAVYKVEVHPPHSVFPPNGMPVFHLLTQNDDGGPLYGKDSYLTFVPPADGEYVVRIRDVRGQQGERYSYRLSIHPPRPDFRLTVSPDRPAVPRGAAIPLDVTAERYDGFDGAIEVRAENLPPGLTAQPATIAAGETGATLTLTAAPDAKVDDAALKEARLIGRASILDKEAVVGLPLTTVLPPPDVTVTVQPERLTLQPGSRAVATVRIERHNGFGERVPIELRNLPYGVKVMDIGLNGVLITETETSRQFALEAEPWVKPQERAIYAVATIESDPASLIASPPVTLGVGR